MADDRIDQKAGDKAIQVGKVLGNLIIHRPLPTILVVAIVIIAIVQVLGFDLRTTIETIRIQKPTPTTLPATVLIENLLDSSETLEAGQDSEQWTRWVESQEENCKQNRYDVICWVILGQQYSTANRYRDALNAYTRAYEINPRISDPYYSRGNLYYELALVDLIRKKRFNFDADSLVFTLKPDEESAVLFKKVIDEYNEGEKYPTIQELNPSDELLITSLHIVGYRKEQISNFLSGSTTITLHRLELFRAAVWIFGIFPDDKELNAEAIELGENLFKYMQAHPEEFPFMIIPDETP